jgi:hypothetical protein
MSAFLIRSGLLQTSRSTVIVEAANEAEAVSVFKKWADENPDKVDHDFSGEWVEAEQLATPVYYEPGD